MIPPPQPYADYQGTRLWRAVEGALRELEANGEVTVATAPGYVIGYLCHELTARGVATGDDHVPSADAPSGPQRSRGTPGARGDPTRG